MTTARPAPPPCRRPSPERAAAELRRAAVRELVDRRASRAFAPTIAVGDPRGRWAVFVDEGPRHGRRRRGTGPPLDLAARSDVVAALLGAALPLDVACPHPLTWLARPAAWDDPDCELAWWAAAARAHAELALPLAFVVVTRHGWRDPRTGEARTWRRLRPRGSAAA